jgi:formate dehydrogenase
MFNDALIGKMKRGAYLVNTARGKICDRDAVVRALKSGQLAGYAGDVWFPQPAPKDHPWRTMPHHGMTPHTSGTSCRRRPVTPPEPGRSWNAGSSVGEFVTSTSS